MVEWICRLRSISILRTLFVINSKILGGWNGVARTAHTYSGNAVPPCIKFCILHTVQYILSTSTFCIQYSSTHKIQNLRYVRTVNENTVQNKDCTVQNILAVQYSIHYCTQQKEMALSLPEMCTQLKLCTVVLPYTVYSILYINVRYRYCVLYILISTYHSYTQ
jgi:hypothetical protein